MKKNSSSDFEYIQKIVTQKQVNLEIKHNPAEEVPMKYWTVSALKVDEDTLHTIFEEQDVDIHYLLKKAAKELKNWESKTK